jgi:1-deoxy-D-xylulose-5-phosphate reductoisomerase
MIVLGSTGSIGVNTLYIAQKFSLDVEVLVAGSNIKLLNQQIEIHKPKVVVIGDKADIKDVNHTNVFFGNEAILEVIANSSSELVVNALVGFLGLRPTLKAIECGKKVALANKESLVAAGSFVDISKIHPIDSEHFGLWYLLQDKPISKMIITASGGAFRDWDLEKIKSATLKDALNHPNWSMGQKITIDSASMMNKLFELLEARWLFGDDIEYDAFIEPKSLIHALINFKDGSTTAHIANANMQLPISHAILNSVEEQILEPIDFLKVGQLNFKKIEVERYPIWEIKDDILKNPHRGVVINAANEVAIEKFVAGKISFLDISKEVITAYNKFDVKAKNSEDIFEIDKEVRAYISNV